VVRACLRARPPKLGRAVPPGRDPLQPRPQRSGPPGTPGSHRAQSRQRGGQLPPRVPLWRPGKAGGGAGRYQARDRPESDVRPGAGEPRARARGRARRAGAGGRARRDATARGRGRRTGALQPGPRVPPARLLRRGSARVPDGPRRGRRPPAQPPGDGGGPSSPSRSPGRARAVRFAGARLCRLAQAVERARRGAAPVRLARFGGGVLPTGRHARPRLRARLEQSRRPARPPGPGG
jgi:hypothetical protein